jgi:hypothetical protein
MRRLRRQLPLAVLSVFLITTPLAAQEPPPRIGPFVLDVRVAFPLFPDDAQLATSRGLPETSLPGRGLGLDAGAHVYLFTWKAVTVGVGAQLLVARAVHTPPLVNGVPFGAEVTERFTSFAPQLSLNFGTGNGWSYLSGGLGGSVWSIVPQGSDPRAADEERLRTVNYGGGARWFAKPHLAFTIDVRFYAVDPGTPSSGFIGSPRSTFLTFAAGISFK